MAKSNPYIEMISTPNAPDGLFERIEKESVTGRYVSADDLSNFLRGVLAIPTFIIHEFPAFS